MARVLYLIIVEALCGNLQISHVFIVAYQPQLNMAERVNCMFIQMISFYMCLHNTNWHRFLKALYSLLRSYALHTAVHESTKKKTCRIFLG